MSKATEKSNLSMADELIKRKEAINAALAALEANPDRPDATVLRQRIEAAKLKVEELEDAFMAGELKRGPGRPKRVASAEEILAAKPRPQNGRQGYIHDLQCANAKLRATLETARNNLANLEVVTKIQIERNEGLIARTQANIDREIKADDL